MLLLHKLYRLFIAYIVNKLSIIRNIPYNIQGKENHIMTKDQVKDLLFEILNEHDSLFTDLTLDDTLNSLIITFIDKEKFIITVNDFKENEITIRHWVRNSPATLAIEMALIILADLKIITEEEREKFHLETTKYADVLEERFKIANI